MIKVFVIDDHPAIAECFEFSLSDREDGLQFVGSARCMEEVINLPEDFQVDVFVLDLFLADSNPVDNLVALKKKFPLPGVVIYSAENSVSWMLKMFNAGANAYHCKCESSEVLFETIKKNCLSLSVKLV